MTAGRPVDRMRLRYTKLGRVRFISHRDVARAWERALRRCELPIAYTEGFAPRPKLSFGLALSTGYESLGEYLDVAFHRDAGPVDVDRLPPLLSPELPAGMDVQAAHVLPPGADSLQQAVASCTWHIEIGAVRPPAVADALAGALAATALPLTRERKGRVVTDDVRPAMLDARVLGPCGSGTLIEVDLATQPRSLRPAEVIAALDDAWAATRVTRIAQWTHDGGARREVIDLGPAATPLPHAEVRAS